MRWMALIVFVAAAAALPAQADEKILVEYQAVMEVLEREMPQGEDEAARKKQREQVQLFRQRLDAFCERWQAQASTLDEGRFTLGRALAQAGRLEPAKEQLSLFVEAHPEHADADEARVLHATVLLDLGRPSESARALQELIATRPKSRKVPVARYYLALARRDLGEVEAALQLLRQGFSELDDPLLQDAHLQYIEILRDAGRIATAREHVEKLLAEDPEARFLLALKEQLDWIGKEAPALVGIEHWVGGARTSLQQLRGQVVILVFFADFYEASRDELKALASLQRTWSGRDVAFLGHTKLYRPQDRYPVAQQLNIVQRTLSDAGIALPTAVSSGFDNYKRYGVRGVPWVVVIDREGKVAHLSLGSTEKAPRKRQALRQAVERLLAR